jgi:hypothetical protein
VSGLLRQAAHVRQARSCRPTCCPRVAVITLGRPPRRARGGHDLLIRRYRRGRPGPFRSARDLERVPALCSCESEESQGRSSGWLPAEHSARHLGGLVLVTTRGPSPGTLPAPCPCPAQTPPPNPTAADPGDGRVQSRSALRVHEPCNFAGAVALRSQPGLAGSGSLGYSYGGFGGGHPHFHPHAGYLRITASSTRGQRL